MKRHKTRRSREAAPVPAAHAQLLRTARSYLEEGRGEFAAMVLERAIATEPGALDLRLALIDAHRQLRQWDRCAGQCREVLAARALEPHAWLALACALLAQGQREAFEQQLPDLARIRASAGQLHELGQLCLEHGYTDAARSAFERAFAKDPAHPGLVLDLARVTRFEEVDEALIRRMEALRKTVAGSPLLLADVHFALGKAYEDRSEDERAASHYVRANRSVAATVRFDAAAHARAVDAVIETFDGRRIASLARSGSSSRRPVLIVGMPRSGTTLVEQVLAAHPQVAAGGECSILDDIARGLRRRMKSAEAYPRCAAGMQAADVEWVAQRYLAQLQSIDASAPRVTDKMPTNFLHLGLAAACLPQASLIHCKRDPDDTALSLYVQQFARGNDWCYRPEDIAAFYAQYERLMAHWRDAAAAVEAEGGRFRLLELDYESLVRDGEAQVRRLVEFVGLEWDARCLRHHEARSVVRTASSYQVRQPMHARSVGRSARFGPFLTELREAMARRHG